VKHRAANFGAAQIIETIGDPSFSTAMFHDTAGACCTVYAVGARSDRQRSKRYKFQTNVRRRLLVTSVDRPNLLIAICGGFEPAKKQSPRRARPFHKGSLFMHFPAMPLRIAYSLSGGLAAIFCSYGPDAIRCAQRPVLMP
jgi:hypothetical protein